MKYDNMLLFSYELKQFLVCMYTPFSTTQVRLTEFGVKSQLTALQFCLFYILYDLCTLYPCLCTTGGFQQLEIMQMSWNVHFVHFWKLEKYVLKHNSVHTTLTEHALYELWTLMYCHEYCLTKPVAAWIQRKGFVGVVHGVCACKTCKKNFILLCEFCKTNHCNFTFCNLSAPVLAPQ